MNIPITSLLLETSKHSTVIEGTAYLNFKESVEIRRGGNMHIMHSIRDGTIKNREGSQGPVEGGGRRAMKDTVVNTVCSRGHL
jgi:hypothetical protein